MAASTNANGIFKSNNQGGVTPPLDGRIFTGNVWFVNASTGADGNIGSQPDQAFATISGALNHCVSGNNDVVVLVGTVHLSATLTWSKNQTHLIGSGAQGEVSQRARISSTGAAAITPLVQVTGFGCQFEDFEVFNGIGAGTTQICWQDSNARNVYKNVHFGGFGSTQAAGATATRALLIDGGSGQSTPTTGQGEHLFERCTFGLDTIPRGVANATLEMQNGSPRNIFRECTFIMDASAATALHMTLGASSIDRWALFRDCVFINSIKSGGTTINQAFVINSAVGGIIMFKGCVSVGATALETSPSGNLFLDMPVPSTSGGLAIIV